MIAVDRCKGLTDSSLLLRNHVVYSALLKTEMLFTVLRLIIMRHMVAEAPNHVLGLSINLY